MPVHIYTDSQPSNPTSHNKILLAALEYIEAGYKIFPLKRGEKIPDGRLAPRGCLDATSDIKKVMAWFDCANPPNIGMSTDNFVAIDIDGKENPWPKSSVNASENSALEASLRTAPMQSTPKGFHVLFKTPKELIIKNSVSKLGSKVDVRGVGGYIVVSPSIVDCIEYTWCAGQELGDTRPEWLPDCPQWLFRALCEVSQGKDLSKATEGKARPQSPFSRAISQIQEEAKEKREDQKEVTQDKKEVKDSEDSDVKAENIEIKPTLQAKKFFESEFDLFDEAFLVDAKDAFPSAHSFDASSFAKSDACQGGPQKEAYSHKASTRKEEASKAHGIEADQPQDTRKASQEGTDSQDTDKEAREGKREEASEKDPQEVQPEIIFEGSRNAMLTGFAGLYRQHGMEQNEMVEALQIVNRTRCRPMLSIGEVHKIAKSVSRYTPDQVSVALVQADYYRLQEEAALAEKQRAIAEKEAALAEKESAEKLADIDPGNVPVDLLRIPGFVSDVMDFTLRTSPYPNKAMAFCGAVALLATLSGRKFRDEGDSRTNLYILGLADSGAGKDRSRKVNVEILQKLGCASMVGSRFASGEGIEDSMLHSPTMLFQTDEIDTMLQSINNSRDGRMESIVFTLLSMYSSANTVYTMRKKASKEKICEEIYQPCLVLYGNAIPSHYYNALSERMVTNGFLARTLVFESERRPKGQAPKIEDVPSHIMEQAKYLHTYKPGGNLSGVFAQPTIIPATKEATEAIARAMTASEAEYDRYHDIGGDLADMGKTIWNRTYENIRKLSVIYALSVNPFEPLITADAIDHCTQIVFLSAKKMCHRVATLSADTEQARSIRKVLEKIKAAKGDGITRSALLKASKLMSSEMDKIVHTLSMRGDIASVQDHKPVSKAHGPLTTRYKASQYV